MPLTTVETELIATEVDELVALVGESNADVDTSVIRRAAAYSAERHAGQLRKSGEPFVMHPLEVAKICAGLRQEPSVIVAAILHDVARGHRTRAATRSRASSARRSPCSSTA